MITPQTHPNLPWQRLVTPDRRINYPHILFAVTQGRSAPAHVYIYSELTQHAYDRPCNAPDPSPQNPFGAARWAIHFARMDQ